MPGTAATTRSQPPRRRRLGDLLLESRVITQEQLDQALADQHSYGGVLGERLIRMGALSEDLLVSTLSEQLGLPRADTTQEVDARALTLIPSAFAVDHDVVPLLLKRGPVLVVATSDPVNLAMLDELRFRTGCRIEPCVAGPRAIHAAIKRLYGVEGMSDDLEELEVVRTSHEEPRSRRWQDDLLNPPASPPSVAERTPVRPPPPPADETVAPRERVRWLSPDDMTSRQNGPPALRDIDAAEVTEPPVVRSRRMPGTPTPLAVTPIPAALMRAGPALPIVPIAESMVEPRDPPSTPRALTALISLLIKKGYISKEEYLAELP
jgi:hypothetical protein